MSEGKTKNTEITLKVGDFVVCRAGFKKELPKELQEQPADAIYQVHYLEENKLYSVAVITNEQGNYFLVKGNCEGKLKLNKPIAPVSIGDIVVAKGKPATAISEGKTKDEWHIGKVIDIQGDDVILVYTDKSQVTIRYQDYHFSKLNF